MNIEENKYSRIPGTNYFGIYIGFDNDGRTSMFVKLKRKPNFLKINQYLIYDYNRRTDGLWAMTVSIADEKYAGVFHKLVIDLVEMTKDESASLAERVFIARFNEWKTMFEKKLIQDLDFYKIVGLAGELYFLNEYMIKKYGISQSIASWIGPSGAEKDFMTNDSWYEVKTKSRSKDIIHISNHGQLSSENMGYLTIISYEKSSSVDEKSTNLIQLYQKIKKIISNDYLQIEFDKKLASIGFVPDEKYETHNFIFHKIDFYKVDGSFPSVLSKDETKAITNIKYDIYVPGISQFRIEV